MKISEVKARKLFQYMGFKAADSWDLPKLTANMNRIKEYIPKADVDNLSQEYKAILQVASEANDEDDPINVTPSNLDELTADIPGADEEEEMEEVSKKVSTQVVEDEEDTQEEASSEEDGDEDEAGKPKKKPGRPKKVKEPEPPPVVSLDEGVRELNAKLVSISPKLAKKFAEMKQLPGDRPLQKARKELYKKVMLAGEFRGATWSSVKIKEAGETYRANGRHTSTASHELFEEGAVLDYFKITVVEYEADTFDDAARLYEAYDPQKGARTKGNLLQTHAHSNEHLRDMDNKVIALATAALARETWEDKVRDHDIREQAENMSARSDFVVWLSKLLDKPKGGDAPKHLTRVPVVQAIYRTYDISEQDANKFWREVKNGENADKGTVEKVFYDYLTTRLLGSGRPKEGFTRVSDREMLYSCLTAWNAWRKDEKWKPNYKESAGIPDAI